MGGSCGWEQARGPSAPHPPRGCVLDFAPGWCLLWVISKVLGAGCSPSLSGLLVLGLVRGACRTLLWAGSPGWSSQPARVPRVEGGPTRAVP